ncbi:hypothetical protein MAPG_12007 [Magnaporthiopsis poae ATCC 64411]|uniref:Nephrocystin 3-like N-terminal domain-containing protein n=1 Tax=Magnaporthiopsis poae (strain ATCC 64411 / 73-15) TaxID=644358 RepID=A0A0C4EGN2_MAGP6|nr:hypothetical protein MAPG_12007 [Magnaporthiopsis poae ATCC 64411]
MDPLSILSIATAVVAFVDFGSKILVAARGLHADDSNKRAAGELAGELQRLIKDAAKLEERAAMIGNIYSELESPHGLEIDSRILQLGGIAEKTAHGVKSLVLELQNQAQPGTANASKAEKDIARLDKAISQIRTDMGQAFIDCIWLVSMENRRDFREIKMLLRKIERGQEQRAATSSSSARVGDRVSWALAKEELVRQIWLDGPADFALDITSRLRVHGHLGGRRPGSNVAIQNKILHSLNFREMRTRDLAIRDPFGGTFEWIFKPRSSTDIGVPSGAKWLDLHAWLLEDSNSIYWITGKPASGKSTLMRYIQGCESLKSALDQWSGDKQLLVASFYAWNSGVEIQKTEEGIRRTILLQFLRRTPQFISRVFPQRWALFNVFGTGADSSWDLAWSREELREACSNFLDLISGSTFKLALFIDGLDEIEDEGAPDSIVDSFRSRAGAKACVSSRPETEFKDHFGDRRGMTLEEITAYDIAFYVNTIFSRTPAFKELQAGDLAGSSSLAQAVIAGASGVFLWVKLVTEALVSRMSKGDSVKELMNTLDSLPQPKEGMSSLYQAIWGRLEHQDQVAASRWFQIYEAARRLDPRERGTPIAGEDIQLSPGEDIQPSLPGLGAVQIFVAEATDAAEAAKQPYASKMQQMDRRLRGCTKGLLELIHKDGWHYVAYHHRSAKDWIVTHQDQLRSVTPPKFDPVLCLVKACAATFIGDSPNDMNITDADTAFRCTEFIMSLARYTECFYEETHPATELIKWLDVWDTRLREKQDQQNWVAPGYKLGVGSASLVCLREQWRRNGQLEPAFKNTLLGLATQYCALSYIKAKLEGFVREKGQVSLLENALFPRELINDGPIRDEIRDKELDEKSFRARLELIDLLLEHGSDPKEKCIMLYLHEVGKLYGMLEGPLIGCRDKPLRECVPLLAKKLDRPEFWVAVSLAFEKHGGMRARFARAKAGARALFSLAK